MAKCQNCHGQIQRVNWYDGPGWRHERTDSAMCPPTTLAEPIRCYEPLDADSMNHCNLEDGHPGGHERRPCERQGIRGGRCELPEGHSAQHWISEQQLEQIADAEGARR